MFNLQTVLDVTWTHEQRITENAFHDENDESEMEKIIYLLDSVKSLCDAFGSNNSETQSENVYESVNSLLGVDVCESVLWRKGNIIYEYCSCKVNAECEWMCAVSDCCERNNNEEMRHKFLSRLIDGIYWLRVLCNQSHDWSDEQFNSGA